LFCLNREVQPSNEELPHLILLKLTYKPPTLRPGGLHNSL
jgi:hypothetical protein